MGAVVNRYSLEQVGRRYLRSLRAADYSPNTLRAYAADLDQLVSFLKGLGRDLVGEATSEDIRLWLSALAEGEGAGQKSPSRKPCSRKSLSRKLTVARRFFSFALDEELIEASPTIGIRSPRVPKRLPRVLTQEQASQLLTASNVESLSNVEGLLNARDMAMLELIYSCGLRSKEVLGARAER